MRMSLVPILLCLLVSPAFTQTAPDILQEEKARKAVRAQEVEQAVRKAERDSRQVGLKNPVEALQILQAAMTVLEADDSLTPEKRAQLKRILELAMRAYRDKREDQASGKGIFAPDPRANQIYARYQEERARAEQQQIQQSFQQLQQLQRAGRSFEAAQVAADLRARFPSNTAVQGMKTISTRADMLADVRSYRELRASRDLQLQRGIILSSIPETEDVRLPPDWVEKSKRRSPAMQLTETERAILKALNSPIDIDFKSEPLQNVLDYLQKKIGQPILVPREVLGEVGATYESPITIQGNRASTRTILKKVLAELNLTYVIKNQVIQVTTREQAKEMMTVRAYYVGDLVSSTGFTMGPVFNQLQMIQNLNGIMQLIVTTIDPQSWEPNGPGSIAFDPINMAIIVRQSAEVHMMLGVGLR
jgi:hypothetical protein